MNTARPVVGWPYTLGLLISCGVLLGCSGGAAPPDQPEAATPAADELGERGGRVCPEWLAQRSEPGYGFGAQRPADSSPTLSTPEEAWVCRYAPVASGPGPDSDGTRFRWRLIDPAHEVRTQGLPVLDARLRELEPAPDARACRSNIGPRWMLVYATGRDLTGAVVDDFGCRDIRLTDDPFTTPPGDSTQDGTVAGVLTGPGEILTALKSVVRGD